MARQLLTRQLLQPRSVILLIANLVPLVGVIFWGWDAFVLLMLYWLETAVIAFWTILRIATMPPGALGDIQIGDSGGNGKKIAAPLALAAFFTVHAGIFMAVHFLFLWALFSGHWSREIHGIGDFVTQMVIGTGLWVPLLFLFFGRGVVILFEAVKPWLWRKLGLAQRVLGRAQGALGPGETLLFGLYIRIVVMQVTIIIGAWFALLLGNVGALLFLIAVKTAVDLSFQVIAEHFHAAWLKAKAEQAATP
jgi:Family of unknown function (DUF6498)